MNVFPRLYPSTMIVFEGREIAAATIAVRHALVIAAVCRTIKKKSVYATAALRGVSVS
jgi:hypothetical protein